MKEYNDYVRNCVIFRSQRDKDNNLEIFEYKDNLVIPHLDGYLITPVECYIEPTPWNLIRTGFKMLIARFK